MLGGGHPFWFGGREINPTFQLVVVGVGGEEHVWEELLEAVPGVARPVFHVGPDRLVELHEEVLRRSAQLLDDLVPLVDICGVGVKAPHTFHSRGQRDHLTATRSFSSHVQFIQQAGAAGRWWGVTWVIGDGRKVTEGNFLDDVTQNKVMTQRLTNDGEGYDQCRGTTHSP